MSHVDYLTSSEQMVDEGENAPITFQLFIPDGSTLTKVQIKTLTLTLTNDGDKSIINLRDGQDIYDRNGGMIDDNGLVTMSLLGVDNPFVATATHDVSEWHTALFTWTWDGMTQNNLPGKFIAKLQVRRAPQATADGTLGWIG